MTGKELGVWTDWKSEELKKFAYPRDLKIFPEEQANICKMRVFADAFGIEFAAVIYLRCVYVSADVLCTSPVGKS